MCGIVAAIAQYNVLPLLIDGLQRLEYRGYDSAGVAIQEADGQLKRFRSLGKVAELRKLVEHSDISGNMGVAHTRWATHGEPAKRNAHPHMSGVRVAIVHNGIIENHNPLRDELLEMGFSFSSETDTEVVAHLLAHYLLQDLDLFGAVAQVRKRIKGAYALAAMSPDESERFVVTREGSPLVVGLGDGENYVASDVAAMLSLTRRFIFLEDGDMAEIRRDGVSVFDRSGQAVQRSVRESRMSACDVDKGPYRHFMLKEIHEQPGVVAETLEGRIHKGSLVEESFGHTITGLLDRTRAVQIIACGTSYHAGLVARYWIEEMGIPCAVEVASEFRYRERAVLPDTLFVTISQSGETADTLSALRSIDSADYVGSLCICNVPESSLVRESDACLMTRAGTEIGVASTKAFTTQLVVLRLLALALGKRFGLSTEVETRLVNELHSLPRQIEVALSASDEIERMAKGFVNKSSALYLGRGAFYPIALEGALKLKEISYIHAEAYPAGELKHGPLALVDANMPVVCALPDDPLLEKVLSNLQEVNARGGELFLITDQAVSTDFAAGHKLTLADINVSTAPMVYSIPLQLLAYYVAVNRGTDVDQPRNLAKSVTVE